QVGLGAQAWATVQLLRWPTVFAVVTVGVAGLYRFAPNVVVPWRWLFIGSTAFSVAFLAATGVVGFYAVNLADFGATYGSLGGLIVLMLWFYITALVLLLGAELSAALAREWSPREIHQAVTEEPPSAAPPEGQEAGRPRD
ncbi:MAG TPA: YihY/virulence factor BrkB family protein, partial [Candidatus Deferrimicrobiaceae bacterium]|nr:YihY/virulence factor BrkB family protein [Candidatus Deferrimicrobiaceae bacterium]